MFEGKPPHPRDARALDGEPRDIDVLRPLSWGDLVARLSAARDLRSPFALPGVYATGSPPSATSSLLPQRHSDRLGVFRGERTDFLAVPDQRTLNASYRAAQARVQYLCSHWTHGRGQDEPGRVSRV